MSEVAGGVREASAYAAPAYAAAAGESVPRDTTPTWELELLVSGAVLFGLFQVPPFVLEVWDARAPHLSVVGSGVGFVVVLLVLTLFYALIGCFVLHLGLRAYWVALVGAHSVFPGGVRWDKQREYGPIQSRLHQERVRPLPDFIGRVDNAASLVFASGFVLGASVLATSGLIALMAVLLWAATTVLGTRRGLLLTALVYFPVTLVLAAAPLVDYKFGGRIDPESRAGRWLRALLRVAQGALPAGVRSLASVLSSNVPKRVVWCATAVGFVGAMGTAAAHVLPDEGQLPASGNYRFFSDAAPGAALPALRYAVLRGDVPASTRGPSIDSDVVTGPYLRLFVPYRPPIHNEALPALCPGLTALADLDGATSAGRAAADAVLRCAARAHRVAIDGRPVDSLRFHFLADPRTNRRGFVAYLPVSALAPGEHALTVWPARLPGARPARAPYEIPFWR